MKRFAPCADEVHYLHKRKGRECDFFRGFSEQGHYKHRGPNETRQGIYCASPSGRFLASVNSNDPARVIEMLDDAWAAWKRMPKKDRYLAPAPTDKATGRGRRGEPLFPADGLALRSYVRDLSRLKRAPRNDWRGKAWNTDTVWFRKAEARRFLPAKPSTGSHHDVPRALMVRLARFCFLDSVRGQTAPFDEAQVKEARMTVTVVGRKGSVIELRFDGATHTDARKKRGFRGEIAGRATYDTKAERFTLFELTAIGTRWGSTRYNFRQGDTTSAPIGFALTLASEGDHTAPAFWWKYWR